LHGGKGYFNGAEMQRRESWELYRWVVHERWTFLWVGQDGRQCLRRRRGTRWTLSWGVLPPGTGCG